jgi:hypothetical protein
VATLPDNSRSVIYGRNVFIVQATIQYWLKDEISSTPTTKHLRLVRTRVDPPLNRAQYKAPLRKFPSDSERNQRFNNIDTWVALQLSRISSDT